MARQINVLLVADDGLTRTIAADGLAMYGYGVVTARDGEDAVEQLKTHRRIDVLVTDADMGGERDGLAVATLARQISPKIDVIYVSRIPYRIPERAKVRGAPCVRSPYHPHQLASVIAALRHRAPSEDLKAVA
ncbi:MAG: response regulator [Microvirga sp.]|jgi:CheY-like chemotaxis protein|nr:response regulator [Beijerinckiaceae bacterium]